jgi:hypothetical protein
VFRAAARQSAGARAITAHDVAAAERN